MLKGGHFIPFNRWYFESLECTSEECKYECNEKCAVKCKAEEYLLANENADGAFLIRKANHITPRRLYSLLNGDSFYNGLCTFHYLSIKQWNESSGIWHCEHHYICQDLEQSNYWIKGKIG